MLVSNLKNPTPGFEQDSTILPHTRPC